VHEVEVKQVFLLIEIFVHYLSVCLSLHLRSFDGRARIQLQTTAPLTIALEILDSVLFIRNHVQNLKKNKLLELSSQLLDLLFFFLVNLEN
jgi:hypothetical protein